MVVRNFLLILAAVVALVSPEFVTSLFSRPVTGSVTRYAAGVGMVWGLGFSLLIGTLAKLTRALHDRPTPPE